MSVLFPVGQVLKGRIGQYVISKQLQQTVWLAKNNLQQLVIVKSVRDHPRVANERDVLKRFMGQSAYIRPMVDEIVEPAEPVTIILRHLDGTLLRASIEKTLTRTELKYVSWRILEALRVIHSQGFVHADIKPDNVMVNFGSTDADNRFTDMQLADFGGSLPQDHQYAREGAPVGAAIWRSPESLFGMPWDVKTDIWSFGTVLISLIYGGRFNLFDPPGVAFKFGDAEYEYHVLRRQFQFFAPPPRKYAQLFVDEKMVEKMLAIRESLREDMKPFRLITEREMCEADKQFIGWFMKLDPRDRPDAAEILAHEWWEMQDDVQG